MEASDSTERAVPPPEATNSSDPAQRPVVDRTEDKFDTQFLSKWDIKKRVIQIFHTEEIATPFIKRKAWYGAILHPNGHFRSSFDLVTAAWVLMLVFMIPFEIGFSWFKPTKRHKELLMLLDLWFAIDIVLNFRTGYYTYGTLVMKPRKIVWNYMTTWFMIDLLGTFPFENFIPSEPSSRKTLKLIKYFKIPKLMRISRIMKYMHDHKYVYDIFQVFMLIFTLVHIGACAWVGMIDPCGVEEVRTAAAVQYRDVDDQVCSQDNIYYLYAEAVHLSAVMMLGISNFHIVGRSDVLDISTEKREGGGKTDMYAVSTLYMILGMFIIALLFGEMNVYIMGKKQGSAAFQRLNNRVKHEMEYYSVPEDLQRQVKAFYDYVWIHQKQYDDKIVLLSDQQMSTDLQRKLALHMFKDSVSNISFFSEVDDFLLSQICLSLRTRIFLPDDMILFKGDVGKEFFIISKGVVEVLRDNLPFRQRNAAPPILLKNGAFFGEISLIMEVRRTCSVRARTICEVNVLQQREFDAILRENLDFAQRMNELVVARYLDAHLTKANTKGIDFQVSTSDMENAEIMVEKNLQEGLERRLRGNILTAYPPPCCGRPLEEGAG